MASETTTVTPSEPGDYFYLGGLSGLDIAAAERQDMSDSESDPAWMLSLAKPGLPRMIAESRELSAYLDQDLGLEDLYLSPMEYSPSYWFPDDDQPPSEDDETKAYWSQVSPPGKDGFQEWLRAGGRVPGGGMAFASMDAFTDVLTRIMFAKACAGSAAPPPFAMLPDSLVDMLDGSSDSASEEMVGPDPWPPAEEALLALRRLPVKAVLVPRDESFDDSEDCDPAGDWPSEHASGSVPGMVTLAEVSAEVEGALGRGGGRVLQGEDVAWSVEAFLERRTAADAVVGGLPPSSVFRGSPEFRVQGRSGHDAGTTGPALALAARRAGYVPVRVAPVPGLPRSRPLAFVPREHGRGMGLDGLRHPDVVGVYRRSYSTAGCRAVKYGPVDVEGGRDGAEAARWFSERPCCWGGNPFRCSGALSDAGLTGGADMVPELVGCDESSDEVLEFPEDYSGFAVDVRDERYTMSSGVYARSAEEIEVSCDGTGPVPGVKCWGPRRPIGVEELKVSYAKLEVGASSLAGRAVLFPVPSRAVRASGPASVADCCAGTPKVYLVGIVTHMFQPNRSEREAHREFAVRVPSAELSVKTVKGVPWIAMSPLSASVLEGLARTVHARAGFPSWPRYADSDDLGWSGDAAPDPADDLVGTPYASECAPIPARALFWVPPHDFPYYDVDGRVVEPSDVRHLAWWTTAAPSAADVEPPYEGWTLAVEVDPHYVPASASCHDLFDLVSYVSAGGSMDSLERFSVGFRGIVLVADWRFAADRTA